MEAFKGCIVTLPCGGSHHKRLEPISLPFTPNGLTQSPVLTVSLTMKHGGCLPGEVQLVAGRELLLGSLRATITPSPEVWRCGQEMVADISSVLSWR